MASLNDSLRVKAAGVKGPAKTGTRDLNEPEMVLKEGLSGGIARSKQLKNAGSSSVVVPGNSQGVAFYKSMGGKSYSDKTIGYF